MSKRRSAALLTAAGMGLVTMGTLAVWAPTASAAPLPPPCKYSSTSTTQGAACGTGLLSFYRAFATCANGKTVYGAWENSGSWQWSYANCATVGSTLQSGGSEWADTK